MSQRDEVDEVIDSQVRTIRESKLKTPKMYRVILHNDDYTAMDFVVEILTSIFNKSNIEANKIMLDVHKRGRGVCGVYTYDVAVSKVKQVHTIARDNEFPLRSSYEET